MWYHTLQSLRSPGCSMPTPAVQKLWWLEHWIQQEGTTGTAVLDVIRHFNLHKFKLNILVSRHDPANQPCYETASAILSCRRRHCIMDFIGESTWQRRVTLLVTVDRYMTRRIPSLFTFPLSQDSFLSLLHYVRYVLGFHSQLFSDPPTHSRLGIWASPSDLRPWVWQIPTACSPSQTVVSLYIYYTISTLS